MSFEFCSRIPSQGWPTISSTACNSNIILLLAFSGILSIEIFITILGKILKKKIRFGLTEAYRQSIFSSLSSNTWSNKASWWLLYYVTSHGIFFIRPLGFILSTLITQQNSWYAMAIFVTTLTDTIFFFDVFFVIFFFGMKIEMLHVAGNPAVSLEERKWFIKTVLKRSSAFALLIFCSGMLRLSSNMDSFTVFNQINSPLFDWSIGMIQYILLFTLAFSRRSYTNYSKIMLKQKINQNKKKHINLSFAQHINTQVLPSEGIPELIRNLDEPNERQFLNDFANQISRQVHISSYVFEDKKALDEGQSAAFPLVDNTREKYIVGIFSLVCITIDSLLNASAAATGMAYKMLRNDENDYEDQIYIITYILMILYIVETVVLSICSCVVVSDKANFGGMIDQRDSNGIRLYGGSLTDNLLGNQEVSLIGQKRAELIHSTNVPESSTKTFPDGVCKEDCDMKTQARDNNSSIHIYDT